MPSEDDMRVKFVKVVSSLLKFGTHDETCPAAGAPHDHETDAPCPCGWRELRKEARQLASEQQAILDREDGDAW